MLQLYENVSVMNRLGKRNIVNCTNTKNKEYAYVTLVLQTLDSSFNIRKLC